MICDSTEEASNGVRCDPNNFINKVPSINSVAPRGVRDSPKSIFEAKVTSLLSLRMVNFFFFVMSFLLNLI